MRKPEVIVALDFPTSIDAMQLIDLLGPEVSYYKVGLSLFIADGPVAVELLRRRGKEVFLDLKLFDIPSTVFQASMAIGKLGISLFTVHGLGGLEMVQSAIEGVKEGAGRRNFEIPQCFVVTALTSWDDKDLHLFNKRQSEAFVLEIANVAHQSRAAGVIASGNEVHALRKKFGDQLRIIVPGVRMESSLSHDQKRITPFSQLGKLDVDYFVIGRAIREAKEPKIFLESLFQQIEKH